MVDAIVGSVIMVVATTSLFLAIDVAERAMNSAGRYCLTGDEIKVLENARDEYINDKDKRYKFWSQNLSAAPTYLNSDDNPEVSKVRASGCN